MWFLRFNIDDLRWWLESPLRNTATVGVVLKALADPRAIANERSEALEIVDNRPIFTPDFLEFIALKFLNQLSRA